MIHDPFNLAARFLEEWNAPTGWITAHTSGSTGTPKEIRLAKADMRRSARATCRALGIDNNSRLHLPLSTDYIAGKMMVVRALESGADLVIERPTMGPMADTVGYFDLTAVVPAQIDGLLRHASTARLGAVIVGGGKASSAQEEALKTAGIKAYATYGMTETCSHVALRNITAGDREFVALPGISFDRDDRGCLVIEAPEFTFGRIVTNDIVDLQNSERFVWLGRYDNVINSGGLKLHPEVIESYIEKILGRPFYVAGRPSSQWGEEAVLYIEATDTELDIDSIGDEINALLPRRMQPKAIIVVPEFERTANGKIRRMLL